MASIYKTDTKAIKKIMVEKEIGTIAELSDKTGVNRNTISKILSGDIQPSADVMDKLVSVLEIKPETAGNIFFGLDLRNK